MKPIKIELSRDLNTVEILILADLHIGDPNCDMDLIIQHIDYIIKKPNVYVILNGDLMNTATKTSVSDSYNETLTPQQQLDLITNLLNPIKDKILCITEGNHERRITKDTSLEVTKILAEKLDIIDRYTSSGALIFLKVGQVTNNKKKTNNKNLIRQVSYVIHVNHGSGGGRKEGSKANKLAEMAGIVDADIYIHSHTHLGMVMREEFYRTDISNSSLKVVDKLFINSSAFLNYGGYGEQNEYKPASKVTPRLYLDGRKKKYWTKF